MFTSVETSEQKFTCLVGSQLQLTLTLATAKAQSSAQSQSLTLELLDSQSSDILVRRVTFASDNEVNKQTSMLCRS